MLLRPSLLALVLCSATGCDSGPSAPLGKHWLAPTFDLQPGVQDDTTCESLIAWVFNDGHLANGSAVFYAPGSNVPRTRCGALEFAEDANDPGEVVLHWRLTEGNRWQRWTRRLRLAIDGSAVDTAYDSVFYATPPETTALLALANDRYEVISFAHQKANDPSLLYNGEINGRAQPGH
jgi:hypothetical protein